MGGMTGAESSAQITNEFGYRTVLATIAKDESLSSAVDIGDARALAFFMPATYDAGKLTFQAASTLTGTYQNLYHFNGDLVCVPSVTQATVVGCPPTSLSLGACRFIKIRTGTAATPVVQTGVAGAPITVMIKG